MKKCKFDDLNYAIIEIMRFAVNELELKRNKLVFRIFFNCYTGRIQKGHGKCKEIS